MLPGGPLLQPYSYSVPSHHRLLKNSRTFKETRKSIPRIRFLQPMQLGGPGTKNRVVVPARQAENRFLGSLKGLQIRALNVLSVVLLSFYAQYCSYFHILLHGHALKLLYAVFSIFIFLTANNKNLWLNSIVSQFPYSLTVFIDILFIQEYCAPAALYSNYTRKTTEENNKRILL